MKALLPRELHQAIGTPQSPDEKPKILYKSIVDGQQQRHPDLLALDAESYVLPMSTVLYLYRRNPEAMRDFVLLGLGSSGTQRHWEHVAAAARDAWNARDWPLLGLLAYRLDRALDQFSRNQQSAAPVDQVTYAILDPESQQPFRHQLVDAFRQAFDFGAGHLDATSLVQAAGHYFRSLPASFIMPASLVLEGRYQIPADTELTLKKDAWPLLEDIWTRHHGAWLQFPSVLDQIDVMPCPWLKYFSRSIRGRKPSITPPDAIPIENPFFGLALDICQDPRPAMPEPDESENAEAAKPLRPRPGGLTSRVMGAVTQFKDSIMTRKSGRKRGG